MYNPHRFTHQGASWADEKVRNTKDLPWGSPEEQATLAKEIKQAAEWGQGDGFWQVWDSTLEQTFHVFPYIPVTTKGSSYYTRSRRAYTLINRPQNYIGQYIPLYDYTQYNADGIRKPEDELPGGFTGEDSNGGTPGAGRLDGVPIGGESPSFLQLLYV